MDSLYRPLSSSLGNHGGRLGASSLQVLVWCCLGAVVLAAVVFRWRVFMASSRYFIVLIVILVFLIWIGRFTTRR